MRHKWKVVAMVTNREVITLGLGGGLPSREVTVIANRKMVAV